MQGEGGEKERGRGGGSEEGGHRGGGAGSRPPQGCRGSPRIKKGERGAAVRISAAGGERGRAETPAEIKAGLKTRLEHVAKSRAKEVLS